MQSISSDALDQAETSLQSRSVGRQPDYGKLPLLFIPNQGQTDKQVAYYVQGRDKTLYFTPQGITLALTAPLTPTASDEVTAGPAAELEALGRPPGMAKYEPTVRQRWVVKLDFVGANPAVQPAGQAPAETRISYFKGQPDEWQADLPAFQQLVYADLWPGIDLVYSGTTDRLKYEFRVRPGADPRQIRLAYRGVNGVSVNAAGQLEVATPLESFRDETPLAYQDLPDGRSEVAVAYALDERTGAETETTTGGTYEYGFRIGAYDSTQPLVIDPAVLVYAGYLGGAGFEYSHGIAVDAAGNAYVTGYTNANETTFPVVVGPDLTQNGDNDVFVAKVNAGGTALVYAGYIGGTGADGGHGIAVDSAGNAYVTGSTNSYESTFPVTVGPDLTRNGNSDAFVAKINAGGTALVYAGYIGGGGNDYGHGIAVDAAGNAYVVGTVQSNESTFPVTVGPDLTYNDTGYQDTFVAKVNAAGTALVYAGYIGGANSDDGSGIAVDAAGNAYVTGYTFSDEGSFPVAVGPDLTYNGGNDAFVAKVNAAGTALAYAGYIGGENNDAGYGIAVDASGNAYLTGFAGFNASTFPVAVGPDLTYNGSLDAFVAKVTATGTALAYAGYLGGAGSDYGYGIAVDVVGNAYVVGHTTSDETTFPVTSGPDLTYNSGQDAFVAKVNAAGTALAYAGYIGGSNGEYGYGIAVDRAGSAYVVGRTSSDETTFPVTVGPDLTYNVSQDAFVAKVTGELGQTVLVVDESGNPLGDASVYRNGALAGKTGANGALEIPDLQMGDILAATWQVTEVATARGNHNQDSTQNWTYRVYLTSVPIDNAGNPILQTVTVMDTAQVLTVTQRNPLIGFNIVVSVEWDANASYLEDLRQGFREASNYLYDATDGQMFFERVTIYDDNQFWPDTDYIIYADHDFGPAGSVYALKRPSLSAFYMFFGRFWAGTNNWVDSLGYRAFIHEFGHYGLGLWDSYHYHPVGIFGKETSFCTSKGIHTNNTSEINATLMDCEYHATEFSMRGVDKLWSAQCEKTEQWYINGRSDWGTIVDNYHDTNTPARWQIVTPLDRGSVVTGPVQLAVPNWMTVGVNDANTGVCASDPEYQLVDAGTHLPLASIGVWLDKGNRKIYQGTTDSEGRITVMGAAAGDQVAVYMDMRSGSFQVACPAASKAFAATAAGPVEVVLKPVPFQLYTSVVPAAADNQVQVRVGTSTVLSGPPQAEVFQRASITPTIVTLVYDAGTNSYTGTVDLDPRLPQAGSVLVTAQDMTTNTLQVLNNFGLTAVSAGENSSVYSFDGQTELYLPAGTLSADARVSVTPDDRVGPAPEGWVILGGAYSIQPSPGITLSQPAGLTMGYRAAASHGVDLTTAQIYRWDVGAAQWLPLASNILTDHSEVSTSIAGFGTYTVMAKRQAAVVYLPLVIRSQ